MFSLFDTISSLLRNVFALSFAAIWGLSSLVLDVRRIADLPWASVSGQVFALALVGAGLLAGFVALVLYLRSSSHRKQVASAPEGEAGIGEDELDRIIARHLASRKKLPPRSVEGFQRKEQNLRRGPVFGRRTSGAGRGDYRPRLRVIWANTASCSGVAKAQPSAPSFCQTILAERICKPGMRMRKG